MKLVQLRLCNFRSFGPDAVGIDFDDTTFVLGPNGAGKTTVLVALTRLFGLDPAQRKIRPSDFHVAFDESEAPTERRLWLEADFEFPELDAELQSDNQLSAVPTHFAHMRMETTDKAVRVRFRLDATLDQDSDIEEAFNAVTKIDANGQPAELSRVFKQDRNAVQVHYLPARRNPGDHISYSTNALLGRVLRAADWSVEREAIEQFTQEISSALSGNAAVKEISSEVAKAWSGLHKGKFYADPALSFGHSEIEALLRHLTLGFTPGHEAPTVDFSRLSDGQQSLLYISLALAVHKIGERVLAGDLKAFDVAKLRPPLFSLVAVEEPENSLSPHYLGRVVRALTALGKGRDAQSVVATHAPSLLRRVDPEAIRYLRLDAQRRTTVSRVILPAEPEAEKYVRQAVRAFPELYFARLVILGEGDSEEVVLPRLLSAKGVLADDASVSVVPLGGRHVNHFWRLLNGLGIPHVTLLDLDLARHQGGWGRVKVALKQLLAHGDPIGLDQAMIDGIPAWNGADQLLASAQGWLPWLETQGVFFSTPLDLDFMMLDAFPEAYGMIEIIHRETPDGRTVAAVLGKAHGDFAAQYTEDQQELFSFYHQTFKLGSKPSHHVNALAALSDADLIAHMPPVLSRMIEQIETKLEALPE